jgi:hypothetical protein
MARVPYSGVTTVDPTGQQTGQLQEQRIGGVSAAAFGGGGRDGVGEALAGLGQQMQQSAWEWEKRQRDTLRTTAAVEWTNFQAENDAAVMKMEEQAPANGIGHASGVAGALTPALDKWLAAQPKWLQEEYSVPATRYFATRYNQALTYEARRQDQFATINIEKLTVEKSNRVNANPAEADAAIAETGNFIKGTTLNPTQQMAAEHAAAVTLRAAQLKAEARQSPWLTQKGGAERLRARESSGDYTRVNEWGFAGAYQFGAPRLAELGVFTPAGSLEGWNNTKGRETKWQGTWNIPGFPEVRNLGDFINNKAAQDAVFALHEQRMDATIAERGWDRLIGQTVRGIPITREGLRYGMHLGGPGGVAAFLEGKDRQDANGTKVADYIAMGRYGAGTIADDPKYNLLPPEQKDALVRDGEREFRQQQAEADAASKVAYAQRYDNLWKDVNDGKAGASEIITARETWLTEPKDIAQLENLLAQSQRKVVDLADAQAKLSDPTYMWTGTESDNKRLNLAYEAQGGNAAIGKMDQRWMDTVGHQLVRQTGFAPPDMVKALETMARQPNAQRMTWAMQQLDRIQADVPGALPEKLADSVAVWRRRQQWLTPEQQLEAVVKDQDPNELAGRRKRIDDAFNGQKSPMNEVDATEVIGEITGAGWFASGAGVDPLRSVPQAVMDQFSGELQSGVRSFMESGLDFDNALSATKEKLGRSWGVSPVGRNGLMKNPPSKAGYIPVNGNYEYMDFQVREAIAAHGVSKNLVNETEWTFFKPNFDLSIGVPVERPYVLVGDGTTQSEIDAKRLPSYDLMYLNDQKIWTSAGRITFDPQRYVEAAKADPVLRARQDAFEKRKRRAAGPIE